MANIYVDPINGDNANAGDSMAAGHAKKTITRGANNAYSITCEGDTIELAAGDYTGANQGCAGDYYDSFTTTNGDSTDINVTIRKWPDASNTGDVTIIHDDPPYCLYSAMDGVTVAFESVTFTPTTAPVCFANFFTTSIGYSFDSDCVLDLSNLTGTNNAFLFNGVGTPKLWLNGCSVTFNGNRLCYVYAGKKIHTFSMIGCSLDISGVSVTSELMRCNGDIQNLILDSNVINGVSAGFNFDNCTSFGEMVITNNTLIWACSCASEFISQPTTSIVENGNWVIDNNTFTQSSGDFAWDVVTLGGLGGPPDAATKIMLMPKITNNTLDLLQGSDSRGIAVGRNVRGAVITGNLITGGKQGIYDCGIETTVTYNKAMCKDPYLCLGAIRTNMHHNTLVSIGADGRCAMLGAAWIFGTYADSGAIENTQFAATTAAIDGGDAWNLAMAIRALDVWDHNVIAWVRDGTTYIYGYVSNIDDGTDTVTVDDWYEYGTGTAGDVPYTDNAGVPPSGSRFALAWWPEHGQYYNNIFISFSTYTVTGDYCPVPLSNYWDHNALNIPESGTYLTTCCWIGNTITITAMQTAWLAFDEVYGAINSQNDVLITSEYLPGLDSTTYKNSSFDLSYASSLLSGGAGSSTIGAGVHNGGGPVTRLINEPSSGAFI